MITRDTLRVEEGKLVTYHTRMDTVLNHEVLVGYQEEPVRELELGLRQRRQELAWSYQETGQSRKQPTLFSGGSAFSILVPYNQPGLKILNGKFHK